MVDSSKFARFIDKAADRLEQIKQSLLKHEKNPNDREFLNDIFRSVHAIKNAALPMGLGRISELCFYLENFLQSIRTDRSQINREKTEILIECKDRLGKLIHEIKTTDKEKAAVKDLIKRIQQEMVAMPEAGAPEPVPVQEAPTPEPAPALEELTPALESLPAEPFVPEEEDKSSLLPDEIKNEEFDRELFQIFIEQMQENISLLRALADGFAQSPSKGKTISLCSELVGKLQTSANYMGYDRLADYYLQWVAELEMAGVELTMGTPFSFDFMDERIKTTTGLFPQVKDTPASAAAVQKAEGEMVPAPPVVRKQPTTPGEPEDTITFKDLFSDMELGGEEGFGEAAEPIAALSDFEPQEKPLPAQPAKGHEAAVGKKRIMAQPVALDVSFLEEERQSPEFDEELFQIFVQQLQENLLELRTLVDSYPKAANKAVIVNQCSTLVGKLQTSANYMGYEPLAEYYLQWIAQLEMAGVDLSLNTPVSFAFMDEHIRKILDVFPQVKGVSAPPAPVAEPAPVRTPAPPQPPPATVPDESASFKELFIDMDEDEDEIFREDSAPVVAALSGFAEEEGWLDPGLAAEVDLPEVDNFFGDLEEPPPAQARKAKPSPAPAFDVVDLYEGEDSALSPEPVAALSGTDDIAVAQERRPAKEVVLPEVDDFFGALGVELPDLIPKSALPPTAPATPAFPVEDLFAEAESAPALEPVAALTGTEEIAKEQKAGPDEDVTLPEVENFFGEFLTGEEESFEIGAEPIAALSDENSAGAPPAKPAKRLPAEGVASLFLDEEEGGPIRAENKDKDLADVFAATAGGDDLDLEVRDETSAALRDSAAADLLFQDEGLAPPRRTITAPADDISSLFGDEEEEPFPAPEEPSPPAEAAPPERQALFRKISQAMKSLEEEVPTLEAAVDKSRARAARPASEPPAPETAQAEEDGKLFARLLGALEATADDDDRGAAKPIDQVIEEILAPEAAQAAPEATKPEELPVQIVAPDIRQKLGLDAGRMDRLMDQVGALAAGRSSLSQLYQEMSSLSQRLQETHGLEQSELNPLQNLLLRLEDTTSALSRVSSEIREGVLNVRMVPAGQLFSLYQELAGNLAKEAGRQVELTVQGEDSEIDQFTVEDIGDCLLHLISNAVRHGIESAEERRQLGKNASGSLTLKAGHESNHVVIEVSDDGRGIDPKIIKATALAREMLGGDELYRISDHDLTRLIMTPGFTTEAGVPPESKVPGLDRVKAIMDRLGGTIQIKSTVGKGTRVRLLIPLKLPTFAALKVKAGTDIFALPLSSVEEIVRVTPENLIRSGDAELIVFRSENIRLHSLARIAGLETLAGHGERFPVVVVKSDAGLAGLIVDEMIGLDEVPVKPMADYLRAHSDFAGVAIKGDSDYSFIPDVAGLMKTATGAAGIRP